MSISLCTAKALGKFCCIPFSLILKVEDVSFSSLEAYSLNSFNGVCTLLQLLSENAGLWFQLILAIFLPCKYNFPFVLVCWAWSITYTCISVSKSLKLLFWTIYIRQNSLSIWRQTLDYLNVVYSGKLLFWTIYIHQTLFVSCSRKQSGKLIHAMVYQVAFWC